MLKVKVLTRNCIFLKTNSSLVKVEHLVPNTTYNVFGTVIDEAEYSYATKNDTFIVKTLERNFVPGNITNVRIGKFMFNHNTSLLDVEIEWDPAKGATNL